MAKYGLKAKRAWEQLSIFRFPKNQPQTNNMAIKRIPKKKFILVAEDDKAYANVYQLKLAKEGYEVKIASDGEEALSACRKRKPDLIILDLLLPIMDGFEVLEALRKNKRLKNLKVLVLSSLSQPEDMIKVRRLGALDYLVKSNITIQEIVDKIREYLDHKNIKKSKKAKKTRKR
jgi:DNA-binding response OmpR family regulator